MDALPCKEIAGADASEPVDDAEDSFSVECEEAIECGDVTTDEELGTHGAVVVRDVVVATDAVAEVATADADAATANADAATADADAAPINAIQVDALGDWVLLPHQPKGYLFTVAQEQDASPLHRVFEHRLQWQGAFSPGLRLNFSTFVGRSNGFTFTLPADADADAIITIRARIDRAATCATMFRATGLARRRSAEAHAEVAATTAKMGVAVELLAAPKLLASYGSAVAVGATAVQDGVDSFHSAERVDVTDEEPCTRGSSGIESGDVTDEEPCVRSEVSVGDGFVATTAVAETAATEADAVSVGHCSHVALLVDMLRYGADAVNAATALHQIAITAVEMRLVIVNAGAVVPLVAMLAVNGPLARESRTVAVCLLRVLVRVDKTTRISVVNAGATFHLVELLNERESGVVKEAAVAVLKRVAKDSISHVAITTAGAVGALVTLLRGNVIEREALVATAAKAIQNLAANPRNRQFFVEADVASVLVALLYGTGSDEVKVPAFKALYNMSCHDDTIAILVGAGIVDLLRALLLDDAAYDVKMCAANVLYNLASNDDRDKALLLEAGFVDLLVALLAGKVTKNVQDFALAALGSVSSSVATPLVALLSSFGRRDEYASVSVVCKMLQLNNITVPPKEMLGWHIWYKKRSSSIKGDWYAKSPTGVMYRSHLQLMKRQRFVKDLVSHLA